MQLVHASLQAVSWRCTTILIDFATEALLKFVLEVLSAYYSSRPDTGLQ